MKTVFIAFALVLILIQSAASQPIWGDIDAWVGKYPTMQVMGTDRRILDVPKIRLELNKLVSAADRKLLASYTNETKIQNKDGFLIIEQCKPHNCPAQRAMIVLDTKAARLWVGFFERRARYASTRWYGNVDDYVVLPDSTLKLFRERHGD